MTVKLLRHYDQQPAGTLITLDATTEAALIAIGDATANLTGGVVWAPFTGSPNSTGSGGGGGGGGGGTWGSITGTLTAQGDLNNALGLRANAAAPVLTGIVTHSGADLIAGTPVVGSVVDFTVGKNTLALTSAVTLTFGGSPATGQSTTLYVTGDTVARVITLPTNTRSALQQAIIASFTVPANWAGRIFFEKSAAGADIDGEPTTLANKGGGGRFGAGGNDTQVLLLSSWFAGTITNFVTQAASGTATYQLTINGINVVGGSNAVSSTSVSSVPSALNIIAIGDKVSIVRSADATCVNADFSLYIAPAKL